MFALLFDSVDGPACRRSGPVPPPAPPLFTPASAFNQLDPERTAATPGPDCPSSDLCAHRVPKVAVEGKRSRSLASGRPVRGRVGSQVSQGSLSYKVGNSQA